MNYLDKNVFESIWIECRTTNSSATKNNQLINISYNPHKHYYRQFLEEFSTSIDYAFTEIKPLVLMGDYNINFLNKNERECLETILIPYGLYAMNKELPTRVVGSSKTLIDYILTDHLKAETFETHVSDTPFRTSKNKPIDHRVTSIINDFQINTNKKVIVKEIFDKKNYRKDLFCRDLESSDWSRFYRQNILAPRICSQYSVTSLKDLLKSVLRKEKYLYAMIKAQSLFKILGSKTKLKKCLQK